ncbi:MAG TPA: orotate phosphoribosyltransferase [Candidatus Cloacimonetes bacterium]|jgi:orotate phosphoribosyltransferase|nr:orotate phosphoribosyltransferase [Candidatus Cloacimonas sp.]HHZ15655.1 orotate phosphoribosyltransferase [Candidatus Cloacimonadota bacterium]
MENYITIAKFENIFEADLARSLLIDNGFDVNLLNERVVSLAPGIASSRLCLELQVPESQEEAAKAILFDSANSSDTETLLKNEGAILEGHFKLTSGRHSNLYIEKIRLLQNPLLAKTLCSRLADLITDLDIDCVVGPAYGGIALAFEVASLLDKSFVFSQRKDGQMTIRSGFDLSGIKKAVVIEDIVTTGGSVKEVIQCLKDRGIEVGMVGALVDRSGGIVDFGVPFVSLLQLDIPTFDPEDCPLCKSGVPITKPGSSDK